MDEVIRLLDEAKYNLEQGYTPLKALWRLVDAAGICAEEAGWPESAVGIAPTGRGFRITRDVAVELDVDEEFLS